jgi:hypothetical protein
MEHLLRDSRLNKTLIRNLPYSLFSKEGDYPSLWEREVRRDFGRML